MELTVSLGGARYGVNIHQPIDISIPVRFSGDGLRAFGAPSAQKHAYADSGFVGAVAKGGSCNCDMLSFAPHLHGTHTECIGHLTDTPVSVYDTLKDSLIAATLITLAPTLASESADSYQPALRPTDLLITHHLLKQALQGCDPGFLDALIIRTLPNGDDKPIRNYGETSLPPFFSIEAMRFVVDLGVKHLLVDMPSIDRLDDQGKLTSHRLFWAMPQGTQALPNRAISPKTVTELIFVNDAIADGYYILNLQLAPLEVDAAPSRPLLYGIKRL